MNVFAYTSLLIYVCRKYLQIEAPKISSNQISSRAMRKQSTRFCFTSKPAYVWSVCLIKSLKGHKLRYRSNKPNIQNNIHPTNSFSLNVFTVIAYLLLIAQSTCSLIRILFYYSHPKVVNGNRSVPLRFLLFVQFLQRKR